MRFVMEIKDNKTISLSQHITELKESYSKLKSEFETEKRKTIEKITKQIEKLQVKIQNSSSLSENEIKQVMRVVNDIGEAVVNEKGRGVDTLVKVIGEVLTIQRVESRPEDKKANMAIFFGVDPNGSIADSFSAAFESKVPIIVPSSIISGLDIVEGKKEEVEETRVKIREQLIREALEWNIYREKGGDFLVFIPKQRKETLEDFDLERKKFEAVSDISYIMEVRGGVTIKNFIALFKDHPQVKKRFILDGHGTSNHIAGMTISDWHQFLDFFGKSKGDFLDVRTCFGGETLFEQSQTDEMKRRKPLIFLVLVRSIGPSSTSAGILDYCYQETFDSFDKILAQSEQSSKGKIAPSSSQAFGEKMISTIEKGKVDLKLDEIDLDNLMLIRFPTRGVEFEIGGFRPLGETERAYLLTYTEMQRQKLRSLPSKLSHPEDKEKETKVETKKELESISLKNTEMIEVFPIVVDIPIHFEIAEKGKAPILHSMPPGDCHHLFTEISLESKDNSKTGEDLLRELIKSTGDFYSESRDLKAFFIKKLKGQNQEFSDLVITVCNGKTVTLFSERDSKTQEKKYFMIQADRETAEIPSRFYPLELYHIARESIPKEEAALSSTGGQQDDQMFMSALIKPWDQDLDNQNLKNYLELCNKTPLLKEDYNVLKNMDRHSLWICLIQAVKENHSDLAKFIIESLDLREENLNVIEFKGDTLLHLAIRNHDIKLAKLLIKREINVNSSGQFGNTPLMTAASLGDRTMIRLLMKNKMIDPSLTNDTQEDAFLVSKDMKTAEVLSRRTDEFTRNNGLINLAYRKRDLEKIKELLKTEIRFAISDLFCTAIRERDHEILKIFIEAHVKIPPSAYLLAAKYGTPSMMELLLKEMKRKRDLDKPLLIAAARGAWEIVDLLLNHGGDMHAKDKKGRGLLFFAIQYANTTAFKKLKEEGLDLDDEEAITHQFIMQSANNAKVGGKQGLANMLGWP